MYLYFRLGVYPYLMPALLPITVFIYCIYKMCLYFRLWVYPYLMPAQLPITVFIYIQNVLVFQVMGISLPDACPTTHHLHATHR